MTFSKTFPRTVKGSNFPRWEEVSLTEEEELLEGQKARIQNISLMKKCIDDAKMIFEDKDLKRYQTDLVRTAISLFEKLASHSVYWKERKAKEKFDSLFGFKK